MPYYDGYTTPETNKICIRCAKLHDNIFYQLCDKCRADDDKEKRAEQSKDNGAPIRPE
jgi:hypothetical protein